MFLFPILLIDKAVRRSGPFGTGCVCGLRVGGWLRARLDIRMARRLRGQFSLP